MTLINKAISKYKEEGLFSLVRSAYHYSTNKMYDHKDPLIGYIKYRGGENIYERDWDILLVLDACRVDALEEVATEYEFLPETIPSIVSVGHGSPTWMANTFNKKWTDELNNTAYISANPHTRNVLGDSNGKYSDVGQPENLLVELDEFLPIYEYAWDAEIGTVPARDVTDNVISYCRNHKTKRVIAHYMQPHFPSVPKQQGAKIYFESGDAHMENNVFQQIMAGEISKETAWSAYIENLRYVLNDVEILLENIEGDVVISADHGNGFGENGCYGHTCPHIDQIRKVPWVKIHASDSGSHEPENERELVESNNVSVSDQLKALGYK